MSTTSATDFCRHFGRYQHEAQREAVEVTSHGRVTGYFVSETEYAHFKELQRREREVLRVGQLPDDVLTAIAGAEYPEGVDPLDHLMEDGS